MIELIEYPTGRIEKVSQVKFEKLKKMQLIYFDNEAPGQWRFDEENADKINQ